MISSVSDTWLTILAWAEKQRAIKAQQLENVGCSHDDANVARGYLQCLKDLGNLTETPPTVSLDDPDY